AGDDRHMLVEQADERPKNARLRLTAQSEQDEVVPREQGVHDLRHDGVFVADHAGEQRSALAQSLQEILPHLVLDRSKCAFGNTVGRALESAESFGICLHEISGTGTDPSAMRRWI